MKVLITGSDGFIGKNLRIVVDERATMTALPIGRDTPADAFRAAVREADAVVHLAGVNRPPDPAEFMTGNEGTTQSLCDLLTAEGKTIPVVFASSIQAERDNDYGRSKRAAEEVLRKHAESSGSSVAIFRLPNVFGKWCRPNYNSAVATFCHQIARGLPVRIDDASAPLRLAYVDDVVAAFLAYLRAPTAGYSRVDVAPVHQTTVGELAQQIRAFRDVRESLVVERVGTGLVRALYATYVSHLPNEDFAYPLPRHGDARGVFVEMLKTKDSGQFSYFTAHPGVTRGGHYHHTKSEKFLVLTGRARFRFRQLVTGEIYEVETTGGEPQVVETVPGWAHDITNIGEGEMVVMLWANEIFDREHPDTVASKV